MFVGDISECLLWNNGHRHVVGEFNIQIAANTLIQMRLSHHTTKMSRLTM